MLERITGRGSAPVGRRPALASDVSSHLTVRDGADFILLGFDEIVWIEAARNVVRLHARNRAFVHRSTLRTVEAMLPDGMFARVHRSALVNVGHVSKIRPEWHGDFEVTMSDGAIVRMSRTHRRALIGD